MERGSKCGEAEKGETLQVKVTVKMLRAIHWVICLYAEAWRWLYPIKRKHIAGSGDALVAPVVINSGTADETSLNDTAAAYSAMTGSDGTKILTITRPDTHGTKRR